MDRSVIFTPTQHGSYYESSVKTPGFRTLVRLKKRLPLNPYLWERTDQSGYPYFSVPRSIDRLYQGYIQAPGSYDTVAVDSYGSEMAILQNKLRAKVRDNQIDLGVSLGEYKETAQFVTSSLERVTKSLNAIRKGNLTGAYRALWGDKHVGKDAENFKAALKSGTVAVSSFWLSFTYGLRPLVRDVYDAVKVLEKRYSVPDPNNVISVKSNRVTQVRARAVNSLGGGVVKQEHIAAWISTRGECSFRVDNPLFRTLDQCGVTNPLSVAWELVPFSFVLDWFIPIGEFVKNIVPPLGVSSIECWYSQKSAGVLSRMEFDPGVPGVRTGYDLYCESRDTAKYRTVSSSIPVHTLVVPDLSLSVSKVGSGIALLSQALLKSSPRPAGKFSRIGVSPFPSDARYSPR